MRDITILDILFAFNWILLGRLLFHEPINVEFVNQHDESHTNIG